MEFSTEFIIISSIILFFASIIHGGIGFGFPMIATPLIALFSDVKTAMLYIAVSTLYINIVSIKSEGSFLEAIKKFYLFAIVSVIGSAIGTLILLNFESEIFKFLLALSIFLYLFLNRLNIHFAFVTKYPFVSMIFFGFIAGLMGGLTNVMASVLIIYSLEANLGKKETIQSSNICFLSAKTIQIILFIINGEFTAEVTTISFSNLIIVIIAMYVGLKLKNMISIETYKKIIKNLLLIIATILMIQVFI